MSKHIPGDVVLVDGHGPATVLSWNEEANLATIERAVGNGIDHLTFHISNTRVEFFPGYERVEDDGDAAETEAILADEDAVAAIAEADAEDES